MSTFADILIICRIFAIFMFTGCERLEIFDNICFSYDTDLSINEDNFIFVKFQRKVILKLPLSTKIIIHIKLFVFNDQLAYLHKVEASTL